MIISTRFNACTLLTLTLLTMAMFSGPVNAGTLVQYNFDASNGTATAVDPNATASAVTSTGQNPNNQFGQVAPAYPTNVLRLAPNLGGGTTVRNAQTNNQYATFTVTPASGFVMNLTSLTFQGARGGSGTPRGVGVLSSVGGFSNIDPILADHPFTTVRATLALYTVDLSAPAFQNLTTAITFRLYNYAPGAGNSVELDDVTLNGSIVSAAPSNTWIGGTDSKWSTGANWSLGLPTVGQAVVLTAGTPNPPTDMDISTSLLSVTFDSSTTAPLTITSSNASILPLTNGIVTNAAAGNHILAFGIDLAATVSFAVGGTGTLTLNGLISGTGGLSATDTGTVVLGNAGNIYTGVTTAAAGTLSVSTLANGGSPSSIGQSAASQANLVIGGGILLYTGGDATIDRGFTSATGGRLNFLTPGTSLSTTGAAFSAGLTIGSNGVAGTLTLGGTGDNNAFGVTVNAGTLILAKTGAGTIRAIGTSLVINNGATVQLTGSTGDLIVDTATLTINTGGTLDLNGLNETTSSINGTGGLVTNTSATAASTLTVGGNNSTGTWSGVIQNGATMATGLVKTGTGTQTLSGTSTYTNGTRITGGILSINTLADTGTSAIGPLASGIMLQGGTLQYTGATSVTTTRAFTGSTAGGLDITNGAAALTVDGTLAFTASGTLTKAGAGTLNLVGGVGTENANVILNATGGTTNLGKTAAGVHAVAGISGIASGATVKIAGATGDQILGSGPTGAAGLVNASLGIFDLNGNNESIDRLTGLGRVTNTVAGTATLTVGESGGSNGFVGSIVNGASGSGIVNVIKIGSGTQGFGNLSTTASNFGSVTVNGGVVAQPVAGSLGQVTLNSNGILDVGVASLAEVVTGFGGNGTGWQLNGAQVTVVSDELTLTTGLANQAGSAYFNTKLNYASGFRTSFVYSPTAGADGMTFSIQNQAPTALGGSGGALGIPGTTSASVRFVIFGTRGIQYAINGAGQGAITPTNPVTLANANLILVTISYYPSLSALKVDLVDQTVPANTFSTVISGVNLATSVTGTTAYVGFSAATGGVTSTQKIMNFTYGPLPLGTFNTNLTVNGTTAGTGVTVALPTTSPSLALGSLTLNAGSQLNVSASTATTIGQNYSLAFGATSLNGSTTLNVAQNGIGNGTVTLGALNDGGTVPATLNLNASATTGAITLTDAAVSMINGSAVILNAGTLNSNNATALGTLTNVTVTAGTANVNAVQTFGALNGAAGAVNLNGNVLTVGSTNNLTSTFGGVIADGIGAPASGGIVLASTGSLFLNGVNTYTGSTSVNSGHLRGIGTINNSAVLVTATNASVWPGTATSAVSVIAGETFSVGSLDLGSGRVRILMNATDTQSLTVLGTVSLSAGVLNLFTPPTATTIASPVTVLTANATTNNIALGFGALVTGSTPTPTLVYTNVANSAPATAPSMLPGGVANRAQLQFSGAVTPVTIDSFTANVEEAGVRLTWNCVSEFQNAGFNVYRRESGASQWVRANPALIAGRITHADAKQYAFYDWAPAGMIEYKLESVGIRDEREFFMTGSAPVTVDWNSRLTSPGSISEATLESVAATAALVSSVKRSLQVANRFESFESALTTDELKQNAMPKMLLLNETAATQSSKAAAASVRSLAASNLSVSQSLAGVRWFSRARTGAPSATVAKVVYSKPGAMLIPQSALPAGFDLKHVSLQREGRNFNALAMTPRGLLVYAPGYSDDYTNKDAIFLKQTNARTAAGNATAASNLFNSTLPVNVTSPASVTQDYHDVYFDYSLRPYNFAPWFSNKYLSQGTTQDFVLNLPLATASASTVTLNLWSLTGSDAVNPDHGVQVSINGSPVGQTQWDGGERMLQLTFNVPQGTLTSGDNTISLTTPNIAGQDSQIALVHSINVSYTRLLDGSSAFEVEKTGTSAQLFEVYNVPSSGAWVVDTRFTDRATLVPSETLQVADGSYRMRFLVGAGLAGKFLVVPHGQENTPLAVSQRTVKPIRLVGTYLATGPAQFAGGVQPLLMKRSKEGVRGSFVDQEQLFDYYNHGRFGPVGIQKAVQSIKPKYLLLVGRTTFDYLNYGGANVDPLCPTFLVSTSYWAQTTSDSAFGDFGRGYPEVAVGRLPVNNPSELTGAVSNILNYKGMPVSGIRLHATADRSDPTSANFGAQLDAGVRANHPDLSWQANYLGTTYQSASEVTAAMKEAANGGADVILYSGHGNATKLGKDAPHILDQAKVQEWTGGAVLLQATCTANWMAKNESGYKSIAIQALTQPQGGISASIGTSTYMNPEAAVSFMNQLLKQTQGKGTRWGTALMKTQQWSSQQGSGYFIDLNKTEQLFGDPAMPVFMSSPAGQSGTGMSAPATGTF